MRNSTKSQVTQRMTLAAATLSLVVSACGAPSKSANTLEQEKPTQQEKSSTTAGNGQTAASVKPTTAATANYSILKLPEKYRALFEALSFEDRAMLVALHREGKTDVLDKAIAEADVHETWLTANLYEVWRPQDKYMHHGFWLQKAYIKSRPWYGQEYAEYAECLKNNGVVPEHPLEMGSTYEGKGSPGFAYGLDNKERAKLKAKVDEVEKKCPKVSHGKVWSIMSRRSEMAADLQREMKVPVGLQSASPDENKARQGLSPGEEKRQKRVPTCLKDKAGYVYHGGRPAHPKNNKYQVAGLKADVAELKRLLKKNPNEFTEPKHAWMIPMLARNGCIEALDVVLQSDMPVHSPDLFRGEEVPWKEDVWAHIGSYATPETFDKILSKATAQNGGKPLQPEPINRDICNYPASFVPTLAKNGITGLENMAAPGASDYILWVSALSCSSPEFMTAFLAQLGDRKPRGALAQAAAQYCYGATTGGKDSVAEAVRMVKALRNLGYKPDDVGRVWSDAIKKKEVSAVEVTQQRPCPAPIKEALTS